MGKRVHFDTLRSLAYTGVSASYAAVGAALTHNPRIMRLVNSTDGDLIISDDNTVAAGKFILLAGTFILLDLTGNMNPHYDDAFVIAKGTIMYAKQATAPTKGAVYVEYTYSV